jgi:hypothetical protein
LIRLFKEGIQMPSNRRNVIRGKAFILLAATGVSAFVQISQAQSTGKGPGGEQTKSGTAATAPRVEATLAQLMKGILFPNSNVIFFAQSDDPAKVPPAKDPATATDPLADTYGKWGNRPTFR